jgi:hypothetical protein
MAQDRQGVHLRDAPGWKIAGQERHRCEQRPGRDPHDRICRACIVEQARQYSCEHERRYRTESESNHDHERRFSDHKLQQIARRCARATRMAISYTLTVQLLERQLDGRHALKQVCALKLVS